MKTLLILAGVLAATPVLAEVTTTIQNGGNTATITQSGDPATVQKKIEQTPGHSRIDQRNGTNTMTIIQDGSDAVPDRSRPDVSDDTDELDAADKTEGTQVIGKDHPPKKQIDVIGSIRNGAPPQSRRNLDQLLEQMGMSKGAH